MTFNLVTGPPCSGKSTFVQQSRGELDIVIDLDSLMIAFGSPVTHGHDMPYVTVAIAARLAALREIAARGVNADVWYVTCWPTPAEQMLLPRIINRVIMPATMEQCCSWATAANRPEAYQTLIAQWFAAHAQRR